MSVVVIQPEYFLWNLGMSLFGRIHFLDKNQKCSKMSHDVSEQYVCFKITEMEIKYQGFKQPDEPNSTVNPADDPNSAGISINFEDASHKAIQGHQTDPTQNGGDKNVEHISPEVHWDDTLNNLTYKA